MASDENELTRDMLASLAGIAISESCGGSKAIASVASVDSSTARRWASGSRGNPAYRVMEQLERAKDPWPMVALFAAAASRAAMKASGPWPEWRWRAEYIAACRAEARPDGAEDEATVALLTGNGTVEQQCAADRKVIAATMKRLVLGYIGMQLGYSLNGPRAH